jgi:NAD(P)-dependent dehydrogenase (short-subunit alcohol dehydrogenase family)
MTKVAIVTGASNGIGRQAALELAERGIGVVLTYHSNEQNARDTVLEIEQRGSAGAIALKLDLNRKAGFEAFAQSVAMSLRDVWQRKTFDYLVNNGGIGGGMLFDDISDDYFNRILNTNFVGPFFLTQRLLPLMENGGAIVNTSSSASHGSSLGYSAYGASKAALTSWTRYLAKELAPRKIRVNAVSPGPVLTNLGDGAFAKHPEYVQPLADQTALGRIGQPADIARVIVSLLSKEFEWVTAQDVEVSGGFLL